MERTLKWNTLEAGDDTEPAARARWLEQCLVGLDLARVIEELTSIAGNAVHHDEPSPQSIRAWLGSDAADVLQHGLGRLPVGKVDELFAKPNLLAGLQELVLMEGGAYWNAQVKAVPDTAQVVSRHRQDLLNRLGLGDGRRPEHRRRLFANEVTATGRPWAVSRAIRRSLLAFASLAAAAAVWILFAPGMRDVTRPEVPQMKEGDRTMIVRADASAEPGSRDFAQQGSDETWPDHPWASMTAASAPRRPERLPPDGKMIPLPEQDLAGRSRLWASHLQQAPSLTTAQIRAAAARARGGVVAIDEIAAADGFGIEKGLTRRLQSTCRKVVVDLDNLQRTFETASAEDEDVTKAKQVIVESLEEIVRVLGSGPTAPADPSDDSSSVGVHQSDSTTDDAHPQSNRSEVEPR